jgi:carboxymethylenebutenolidase
MCFDHDSLPPIPPVEGGAVAHEDLLLEAADGNRFAAFAAHPDEPGGKGVVILPDVRGLYRFYEELALRFAERGIEALAIDYFGRTAGVGKRGEDFDYREHVAQTTPEGIRADVRAAVEHLRGSAQTIFTVGFCFGGRNSWLAAASGHDLAGAIGFYGRPGEGRPSGTPGPIQRAPEMTAPILALQGGDDPGIPVEDSQALEAALQAAGIEHEVVIYPGAPHSFFDRKHEEFAAASEDAWNRVLAFIERHSYGGPGPRAGRCRPYAASAAVLSPSSDAIGCIAATTFAMCSSSSSPSRSAPA